MPFCVDTVTETPKFYLTCDGGELNEAAQEWTSCTETTTATTDPNEAVRAALAAGWVIDADLAYCPTHADG